MSARGFGGLLAAIAAAQAVGVGIVVVGNLLGADMRVVPILSACTAVAMAIFVLSAAVTESAPPSWPSQPRRNSLPETCDEPRTRRLAAAIESAETNSGPSTFELQKIMAAIAEGRMVSKRAADPDHPLADLDRYVSAGCASYLRLQQGEPPRLSRRALHTYIEELNRI